MTVGVQTEIIEGSVSGVHGNALQQSKIGEMKEITRNETPVLDMEGDCRR